MKKHRFAAILLAAAMIFGSAPAIAENLTVTASAASTKLAAPKDFKATSAGASYITLSWRAVSGANAYVIYKYNDSTKSYKTYKTVTGINCTVNGLSPNTSYSFKVAALVKNNGKYKVQKKSDALTAKTNNVKLLSAPTKINTSTSTSAIKICWKLVSGATAYRVYIYDEDKDDFVELRTVFGNYCDAIGLKSSHTYVFRVATLTGNDKDGYVVNNVSDDIVARTMYMKKGNLPLTPSEFKIPEAGTCSLDVFTKSGVASIHEYMADSTARQGAFLGKILYNNQLSQVEFIFNEYDELFKISIMAENSSFDDYSKLNAEWENLYGSPYSDLVIDVRYKVFTGDNCEYRLAYNEGTRRMHVVIIYKDYLPKSMK